MKTNTTNKKSTKKSKLSILVALFISSVIVSLLFLAGPANAFNLTLNSNSIAQIGNQITFVISLILDGDQNLPIDFFRLTVNGPVTRTCDFDVDGNMLSSCTGIVSITRMTNLNNQTGYGYGYYNSNSYSFGYNDGVNNNISYEIVMDTNGMIEGDYTTQVEVKMLSNIFSNNGNNLTLSSTPSSLSGGRFSGSDEGNSIVTRSFILQSGKNYILRNGNKEYTLNVGNITQSGIPFSLNKNDFVLTIADPLKFEANDTLTLWYIGKSDGAISINSRYPTNLREVEQNLEPSFVPAATEQTQTENLSLSFYDYLVAILIILILIISVFIVIISRK